MIEILLVAIEDGGALPHAWLLIGLALLFGLFMAWSIGANDVANAMGTSVGSKALTLKQAIIIAAFFEFAGALLVGRHVSDKIRSKIFYDGVHATGQVELVFKDSALVTIETSTLFKTDDGIEFELEAELSGKPHPTDTAGIFVLPAVKVVAVTRGEDANLKTDSSLKASESYQCGFVLPL